MPNVAVKTGPEFVNPTVEEKIAVWETNDLSEVEKKRPYAKYYYKPLNPPNPETLKAMEKPCDPAKIIWPEQINDLLNPGYLEVETGWCQMPNGGGFIANLTKMPDVTAEMITWWFTWFTLNDQRYKIWYRPSHIGHYISPERRKIILDPRSRIPEDTVYGATHHAVEDVGVGPELIDIHFYSPEDMGFDVSRVKQPYVSTVIGGYGDETVLHDPDAPRGCAFMVHFVRDVLGGVEWRTRFWMGYRLQNKKADFVLPPGAAVPVEAVQGLAVHNVHEYSNFKVMLPEVFKEFGGRPIFED